MISIFKSKKFEKAKGKNVTYVLLILCFVYVNIWIYYYKNKVIFNDNDDEVVYKDVDILDLLSVKQYQDYSRIKDIKGIDSHSSNYESILKKHRMEGIMNDLSFQDRCDLYFNNLFEDDVNWSINLRRDLPLDHRHEFKYNDFKRKEMNSVKDQYAKDNNVKKDDVTDEMVESLMKEKYEKFWAKTMETEQIVTDYVSHLRIFNKCFVSSDNTWEAKANNKFISEQKKFAKIIEADERHFRPTKELSQLNTGSISGCSVLESRLYPWLSFNYPTYIRWTGEKLFQPPVMSKYVKHKEVFDVVGKSGKGTGPKPHSKLTNNKACFLNTFKNSLNGRGIVLSIADHHVDLVIKLIYLLRALHNKYPIQIVYYDGLSEESMERISHAATMPLTSLPKSFDGVKEHFPEDYMNSKDNGLITQEVWYVSARNAIHESYRSKFEWFSNKFFATFFNSFEEYILIDADTVLIQPPEYFFNLMGYKEKGAYFYKDRIPLDSRPESDLTFFKKISPSLIDTTIFDIPVITEATLGLEFFQGNGHLMESGLVVINRNLHFNSILMMLLLNMMSPIRDRVHGDKEIFWLGFAINGDENFQMNKYAAAAIGEVIPAGDELRSDGTEKKTKKMCSSHPAHINGEDGKTLVWFNSGFKFCSEESKVNYEKEFKENTRYKFLTSVDDMKAFYKGKMALKAAIIPPVDRKAHVNIEQEPERGWARDNYCNAFMKCAYYSIGGKTKDGEDNLLEGQYIEFDDKTISLYSYLADIWMEED